MLSRFAVVDPIGVVVTDPLAPAVQVELTTHFVPWQGRVTHTPEMRLETSGSECLSQTRHPAGNAPSLCIYIRSLKGEHMTLH